MELEAIVRDLCDQVPSAIGCVLCDFDGERVVSALGRAPVPAEAEARAREHIPKNVALAMPIEEFLLRLAGAEPAALLRLFGTPAKDLGAGDVLRLELAYARVEVLVRRLPNEFYVVLVLRRPAVRALARRALEAAAERLLVELE